jgi:LysM repeat protein
MASVLFHEASKNGIGDGITIMAIRVDEIKNIIGSKRLNAVVFDNKVDKDEEEESSKGSNIVNYILAFVCILVISGVLFMGYLIVKNSGLITAGSNASDSTQSSVTSEDTSSQTNISSTAEETVTDSEASISELAPVDNNQEVTVPSKQNTETGSNQNENGEYDIHIVKSGDTLSSISTKYYGDPNKYDIIIKYNSLKNENSLYVDQELKIPKVN